jgi:hypothetical protein
MIDLSALNDQNHMFIHKLVLKLPLSGVKVCRSVMKDENQKHHKTQLTNPTHEIQANEEETPIVAMASMARVDRDMRSK